MNFSIKNLYIGYAFSVIGAVMMLVNYGAVLPLYLVGGWNGSVQIRL